LIFFYSREPLWHIIVIFVGYFGLSVSHWFEEEVMNLGMVFLAVKMWLK